MQYKTELQKHQCKMQSIKIVQDAKVQSRLHLLRRQGSFSVCRALLSCALCRHLQARATSQTGKWRDWINCSLESIEEVVDKRMLVKLTSMTDKYIPHLYHCDDTQRHLQHWTSGSTAQKRTFPQLAPPNSHQTLQQHRN